MFEVQDLRYATLATVSRCGMVWFSEDVLSIDMICENFMLRLRNVPVEEGEEEVASRARSSGAEGVEEDVPQSIHVCHGCIVVELAVTSDKTSVSRLLQPNLFAHELSFNIMS